MQERSGKGVQYTGRKWNADNVVNKGKKQVLFDGAERLRGER